MMMNAMTTTRRRRRTTATTTTATATTMNDQLIMIPIDYYTVVDDEEEDDIYDNNDAWYKKASFVIDWVNKFLQTYCFYPGFAISIDEINDEAVQGPIQYDTYYEKQTYPERVQALCNVLRHKWILFLLLS
jgi:hypothetical protein